MQELFPTEYVEVAREIWLETGHNSHEHSFDPSVGLAQPILLIRLGCQRILTLFALFDTLDPPTPLPPVPSPPPPPAPLVCVCVCVYLLNCT